MKATGWIFADATGVERHGYIEGQTDRGGADISYMMRDTEGKLHVITGAMFSTAYRSGRMIDCDQ